MKSKLVLFILPLCLFSCDELIEPNETDTPKRFESQDEIKDLLVDLHPEETEVSFCQKRAAGVRFKSFGQMFRYRTNEKGDVAQIHEGRRTYYFSNTPDDQNQYPHSFILNCDSGTAKPGSELKTEVIVSKQDPSTGRWAELNNGLSIGKLNTNCELELNQNLDAGSYRFLVVTENYHNLNNDKAINDHGLVYKNSITLVCTGNNAFN